MVKRKLKFPYTMYCPGCKAGLKIKSEKLVGTMIHCPKCKKRIPIVTPEEDGYIPYGVEAAPEPEPEPEPTEEELEEKELERIKEKRKKIWGHTRYWLGILWLLLLLAAAGGIVYYFVDFKSVMEKKKDDEYGRRFDDPSTKSPAMAYLGRERGTTAT